MLHTVITGPPGVGKTELGKILGKVYKAMGILSKGHVNIARRPDLIAKYLGQTAPKTQSFIDKCKGGVMFIDEAYSLGNPEGRDSFSKECIDTINQNLTERRDFLCIIAGYEDSLESSFFSYNEGLKRRFSFKYNIEKYTGEELYEIFIMKINKEGWEYIDKNDKLIDFFKKNNESFPRFGGDIETLFLKTKIMHSRRIMFKNPNLRKKISYDDVIKGFDKFKSNRKTKEDKIPEHLMHMYV
jgi:SpoVK/Ycf46/Vps4 family AAA+-type ATPase